MKSLRYRPIATRWGAVLAAVLALALTPAVALASGFSAALSAPTHTPKVGRMPITVRAWRGSQKLSGTVSYEFTFNGMVVGHAKGGSFHNGVYHDTLKWPARSVGINLHVVVVVKTRYGTDYLPWWIKVRR